MSESGLAHDDRIAMRDHGHDPVEQGLALALAGRCPFCAEVSPRPGTVSGEPCVLCGGMVEDRAFVERVLEAHRSRSLAWLGVALVALGVATLLLSVVPFSNLIALPIALLVLRARIVAPPLALMRPSRRFVSRWTLRLFTALAVTFNTAFLVPLPWVGAFMSPALLATTTWVSRGYVLAQLERERDGAPVGVFEWGLLAGTASAALLSALVVVLLIGGVFWAAQTIDARLHG